MKFSPADIPDVVIIEPRVFRDERGFFLETYHEKKFQDGGVDAQFVQDNHSRSVKDTLRGLHAQRRRPQGKLVRAVVGEIFDVAVDIRPHSPTFGRWVGVTLSAENFRQLYVPPGFAHGFCVVSETAEVIYKCTALYDPSDELGVAWDDSDIGIQWPTQTPILSPKDAAAPRLRDLVAELKPTD
jgi:dTDP-4-dehydrorhamnose 3,5-epimerase